MRWRSPGVIVRTPSGKMAAIIMRSTSGPSWMPTARRYGRECEMAYLMRCHGPVGGMFPIDLGYLKTFDPNVVSPDRSCSGFAEFTHNKAEAMWFDSLDYLPKFYGQQSSA